MSMGYDSFNHSASSFIYEKKLFLTEKGRGANSRLIFKNIKDQLNKAQNEKLSSEEIEESRQALLYITNFVNKSTPVSRNFFTSSGWFQYTKVRNTRKKK